MDNLDPRPASILLATFAAFGIFGNLNIIAATVRTSTLRTTCNCLIAITAFFDIIHECSQQILLYFVFFAPTYPTLETCFMIQFVPMIGSNAGQTLMFLTSLDRLYCVSKPVAYQQIPRALELLLCVLIALLFAGWLNYEAYTSLQLFKHQTTLCSVASSYTGRAHNLYPAANGIMNLITVLVYGAISFIIKKIAKQRASSMLRSIAAVTFCVVGGWLLTFSLVGACLASGMAVKEELRLYTGLPVNLSISLNYPIYFMMSGQYRQAFKQQLNILTVNKVFKNSSQDSSNAASVTRTNKENQVQPSPSPS